MDAGIRRLALGTLLAAFPGPFAPPWALGLVEEGLAGYTLFGFNIDTRAQVAALTASLRAARPEVIIAVDEEGGDVTRLGHATGSPYPGNAALGAVDDPDLTAAVYAAVGAELAECGITMNLAPSVDVNTAEENPIIGTRSFGANPSAVARHAAAAVLGLQSTGVSACAKHFPGHGSTAVDSHLQLPTVDCSLDLMRRRDLPPFAAAIEAGTRAIMTAHIRLPALTGALPATLSPAALGGLLRDELGYRGVIVTDALEMRGVSLDIASAAVRALVAGADLLCLGAEITLSIVESCAAAIAAAVADGSLPRTRLEDAASRVAGLASARTGASSLSLTGTQLGLAAARRAVSVEGTVPDLAGDALVVQLAATHSIAEGVVPWGLDPHVDGVELVRLAAEETTAPALLDRAGARPLVVVGRHLHRATATRSLVEALARAAPAKGLPLVVVEMGWPAAWRPAGATAFLRTYGASRAAGRAAAEALGLTPAA